MNYVILLPCHKEYSLLEETSTFYSTFLENNKVEVYIITGNERDENEGIVKNDSYERLKEIIKQKNISIHLLKDKSELSTKTTKLNYGLNKLHRKNSKKTFVGVYDFDARPHENTIRWIDHNIDVRINSNKQIPAVYQQIPHILKGVNSRKPQVIDFLSINHIKRSLGIEGYKIYSRGKEKKILYLMGSGMYINLNELRDVGGFPKYSDDIALGHRLNLLNKSQVVIPFPAKVSALSSPSDYFKQLSRIYYGAFSLPIQHHELKNNVKYRISRINYFKKLLSILFDTFREGFEIFILIFILILHDQRFEILLFYILSQSILFFFYNLLFLKISSARKGENFNFKNILINCLKGGNFNNIFRTASLFYYFFNYKSIKKNFQISSKKSK